jgi:hypothetical protein
MVSLRDQDVTVYGIREHHPSRRAGSARRRRARPGGSESSCGRAAHLTGKLLPLDDARRVRTRPERTRVPGHRVSVPPGRPAKPYRFTTPWKPTPLGGPGHLDPVAGLELLDGELLTELVLGPVDGNSRSTRGAASSPAALAAWPISAFAGALGLLSAEAELDGLVAVGLSGLDLCDRAGTSFDDGHGHLRPRSRRRSGSSRSSFQ